MKNNGGKSKPEIEILKISDLIPYARNSRTHSDAQVSQIAGSIREFGFTNPVLIDSGNGIIAGHGRVMAAHLISNPAPVHFVSYEPAIGPLDQLDLTDIEWVIYGGESGPGHRPEDKQWARDMHARCAAADVAFFHKQSAGHRTEMGIELDGKIVREYPRHDYHPSLLALA